MNAKAADYIRDTLLAQLNQLFAPIPDITANIDNADPHTVNVHYPAAFRQNRLNRAQHNRLNLH